MTIHPKNNILALCLVLIIFLGVSIYLLNKNIEQELANSPTKQIETLSPSNDTRTIETEVSETDFTEIDAEMRDIENELNSY